MPSSGHPPRRSPRTRVSVAAALTLSLAACRAPTQIVVEVTTDVPCADTGAVDDPVVKGTAIVVGSPAAFRAASRAPAAVTTSCVDGRMGSLVVVPSDGTNDEIGIRVAVGTRSLTGEQCAAECGSGCVQATRVLRFVPHESLELPIDIHRTCIGVCCPAGSTCVKGDCVPDTVRCAAGRECGLPSQPGSLVWTRRLGGAGDERVTAIASTGPTVVGGEASGASKLGSLEFDTGGETWGFVVHLGSAGDVVAALTCAAPMTRIVDVVASPSGETTLLASSATLMNCGGLTLPAGPQSSEALVRTGRGLGPVSGFRLGGTSTAGRLQVRALTGHRDAPDTFVAGTATGSPSVVAGAPALATAGPNDVFVASIDRAGAQVFARILSATAPVGAIRIGPLQGSLLVALDTDGSITVDGTVVSAMDGTDVLLLELDATDGRLLGSTVITGAGATNLTALGSTGTQRDPRLLLGVEHDGDVSWDNGSVTTSFGRSAIFLSVENGPSARATLWHDGHRAVAARGDVLTDYFATRSADTGLVTLSASPGGAEGWRRTFGDHAVEDVALATVVSSPPADAVLAATFSGAAPVGEPLTSNGGRDVLVARFSELGDPSTAP